MLSRVQISVLAEDEISKKKLGSFSGSSISKFRSNNCLHDSASLPVISFYFSFVGFISFSYDHIQCLIGNFRLFVGFFHFIISTLFVFQLLFLAFRIISHSSI